MERGNFFENIVVGAGVSGLTLAQFLDVNSTLILEKSRGLGGRMATRREGEWTFDHGAQFYECSDESSIDSSWIDSSLSQTWFESENRSYRAAPGGITKLAKHLASGKSVQLGMHLESLRRDKNKWILKMLTGETFESQNVYLSCPLPQSLNILNKSSIEYPKDLEEISYDKALVGLFCYENNDNLQFSFKKELSHSVFSISNQISKRVSQKPAVTVVMSPEWSEKNFDKDDGQTLEALISETKYFLPHPISAVLKKWRYAQPRTTYRTSFLELENNVYLLGDAFGGPSIVGGWRSASELAKSLDLRR